mgnify:CR=1 FL=1
MYKETIIENLEIIGIKFKSQLEKNDINFWWQKKYTEILKSDLENKNELLITLNNALEGLEKIDVKTIKAQLKTEPSQKKSPESKKKDPKINEKSNKTNQKSPQRETDNKINSENVKNIKKEHKTGNNLIEANTNQKRNFVIFEQISKFQKKLLIFLILFSTILTGYQLANIKIDSNSIRNKRIEQMIDNYVSVRKVKGGIKKIVHF